MPSPNVLLYVSQSLLLFSVLLWAVSLAGAVNFDKMTPFEYNQLIDNLLSQPNRKLYSGFTVNVSGTNVT